MKRKLIIAIIITALIPLLITYNIKKEEKDSEKFKKEYEQYNEITKDNDQYIKLDINKKNPIVYLDSDNIIENLKGKDKVIFIAKPNDNNSRKAVKILLELAKENSIEKIYYYNPSEIINNSKTSNTYKELTKQINNEKELIIPTLLLVKNNKIDEIYQSKEFNREELMNKYERILIKYTLCTEECK